jgi:hypothetical protein
MKTATLKSLKQAFYTPTVAIILQKIARITAYHNQIVASIKRLSSQVNPGAPEQKLTFTTLLRTAKESSHFINFTFAIPHQIVHT